MWINWIALLKQALVEPLRLFPPIGGIQNGEAFHVFYSETEVGPKTRAIYDELTGIQFGERRLQLAGFLMFLLINQ